MAAKKIPGFTTHPDEWRIWRAMRSRCNPDLKQTKDTQKYIEKGITVCPKWDNPESGFQEFLKDMGPRPSKKHSIDRIDNSKGYFPDNCRWATPIQQARNTDSNRMVEFSGESLCVAAAAEKAKIGKSTLGYRLNHGWKTQEALETNVRQSRKLTYNGVTKTARAWAIELGIPVQTVYRRVKRGLPIEEILSLDRKTGKYCRQSGKFYGRGIKK